MHFNNLEKKKTLFLNDLNSFISPKKKKKRKSGKKIEA